MANYRRRSNKPKKQTKAKSVHKESKVKKVNQIPARFNHPDIYLPPEADGLNDRQIRFCHEFIVDLNKERATERAGYSKSSSSVQANMLMKNPRVRKYIAYLKIQRARRLEVTQDRIVQELARMAYHDKRTFYDKGHKAIPLAQVTDDQQTAIKDIQFKDVFVEEPVEDIDGNIKIEKVPHRIISKYIFYDKANALRMLGHHLGMSLDRPAEHAPIEKDQEAISFEMLIRKLEANQLEKLTQMLLVAQQALVEQPKPMTIQNEAALAEDEVPEDHWSKKTEGQMQ